ncbi:hypothetical protein CR513_24551, partial [Mucuna pruriens]
MLLGLKNVELEKCSHCMAGKQTKVSFKKHPPSRKSKLLKLVHSDVCGLMKVKSFSGAPYFVTFIDDCSRKFWVYTLKKKDQVLEKFKQFQALVDRQSGKKVKCIHSDNGALYTIVHVINLNLVVTLNNEVTDKIWFDKDVKLGSVSSLGMVRMSMVTSYMILLKRNLSEPMMCNSWKTKPLKTLISLSEIDPVWMHIHDLDTIENNLGDVFYVPPNDDAKEEQEMSQGENLSDAPNPPLVQLKKSNRERESSTGYTSNEYVTLIDGEELECY